MWRELQTLLNRLIPSCVVLDLPCCAMLQAHAVGLWGIPVMMVDSISRLIITQVCRELHLWLAEPITFSRYGGVCECSRFMLEAWDFISPDQTGRCCTLPIALLQS
jgi:hypothetical protein